MLSTGGVEYQSAVRKPGNIRPSIRVAHKVFGNYAVVNRNDAFLYKDTSAIFNGPVSANSGAIEDFHGAEIDNAAAFIACFVS